MGYVGIEISQQQWLGLCFHGKIMPRRNYSEKGNICVWLYLEISGTSFHSYFICVYLQNCFVRISFQLLEHIVVLYIPIALIFELYAEHSIICVTV